MPSGGPGAAEPPWRGGLGAGPQNKQQSPQRSPLLRSGASSRGLRYKHLAKRSEARCEGVDLAGIEPPVSPQAADATESSWNWGGRVGDVQSDTPRKPDTGR